MKKFALFALLAVLFMVWAAPADAVVRHYTAQVYRMDLAKGGDQSVRASDMASTGITYKVLAIGTSTAETIYSRSGLGGALTSKTNPVTTTYFASDGGRIDFWCDPTDSTSDLYVDLIVVDTTGGYTAVVKNFSPNHRSVMVDETLNKTHHGVIWFGASSTSEINTGVTFQNNTMIHDVRVSVVTAASAISIDVGFLSSATTAGDPDGLRANVLLTTTGYVADTGVVTGGTTIDWTAASTYGVLLYTSIAGSDAVASGGGRSYLGYIYDAASTGVMTYTMNSTTGAGYLHYWFTPMR